MSLWLPLLGGAGLLKGIVSDVPRAAKQRKLAAETQRYSPWTELQAQQVQEPDIFGSTLQGVAAGATMDQMSSAGDSVFSPGASRSAGLGVDTSLDGIVRTPAGLGGYGTPFMNQGDQMSPSGWLAMLPRWAPQRYK